MESQRPIVARVARQQARRSLFTPSAIRSADLVQDMYAKETNCESTVLISPRYLRELKAYKPAPVKASDAEGHVQVCVESALEGINCELNSPQKFAVPQAPKSPEETDLASELKSYETQQVEVEGASSSGESAQEIEDDWFEPEEEATPSAAH
jgi:F-type H+-transporting ATPase subunit h